MTHAATLNPEASKETRAISRTPSLATRLSFWLIATLLISPVAAIAFLSGVGLVRLPYEMYLLAERVPALFRLHMAASALALFLLPLVIALRHRRHLHRRLGRALGVFVVAGGLTALPVAVLSSSGEMARAGFFVQGLVWLGLLWAGWRAIRSGERQRHARLMLMMGAVTTGAVWFRLIIGGAIAFHLPFEPMYALAAWAGWTVPLALVALWPALRANGQRFASA